MLRLLKNDLSKCRRTKRPFIFVERNGRFCYLLAIKSIQITNLEQQNNLKDTIILSHKQQVNELQKSVKKEKRNKWLFGVGGFLGGLLIGKL